MNIIICDDSALARKSLARCIAKNSEHTVFFAEDGSKAVKLLEQHQIDIMFLDLTMPVMDGFQVLAVTPVNPYPTKIIVVSGDVQQEAINRCMSLGAYQFIKKPFDIGITSQLFEEVGLEFVAPGSKKKAPAKVVEKPVQPKSEANIEEAPLSPSQKFKELTNVALGAGAAVISDYLGEFIQLPIPNVATLESSELHMLMTDVVNREASVAVAQRFVGSGLYGEALVCMRGSDIPDVGVKLGYRKDDTTYNEVVMNVANLLVSSFMTSLAYQIGVDISLRQPVVIEPHHFELQANVLDTKESTFTTEFVYVAENLDFDCEVLFLFDQASKGIIEQIMESF
jgi:CheY-like chemotaxis protein